MILLSNFRVIAAHWDQRPFKWLSETWRHTKPRFAITNGAIERDTTPFKKHKWQSSSIIGNNEWKLGLFAVKIKHFFFVFSDVSTKVQRFEENPWRTAFEYNNKKRKYNQNRRKFEQTPKLVRFIVKWFQVSFNTFKYPMESIKFCFLCSDLMHIKEKAENTLKLANEWQTEQKHREQLMNKKINMQTEHIRCTTGITLSTANILTLIVISFCIRLVFCLAHYWTIDMH